MFAYTNLQTQLRARPRTWLVTGVAGFIGSNLLEALLKLDQRVIGLDNYSTGRQGNFEQVQSLVGTEQWARSVSSKGALRTRPHVAARARALIWFCTKPRLVSVPRSIESPLACHAANVTGFINMLEAARGANVKRFVYASSSAVFGDHPGLPKIENEIGLPLSPYAASKRINEVYASAYAIAYGFESIGLRYFNVFGPRQDPNGAYAAVIPKWIDAMLRGETIQINGDGETSRDFCFVDNIVQANLLAATTQTGDAPNQVYNIAVGERTTLNELFSLLQDGLRKLNPALPNQKPRYADFRAGDVRHSHADITKARSLLGYDPALRVRDGLNLAMEWYYANAC